MRRQTFCFTRTPRSGDDVLAENEINGVCGDTNFRSDCLNHRRKELDKSKWNTRGLASLITAVGFVIVTFTGIIAYIMPHGRIAYWTNWSFLGLSKTNWENIHILGGLFFLVAIGFHVYFNWKSLTNYLVDKTRQALNLKREMALSIVAGCWIVLSAIFCLPPLSYVLDLNDYVKASWVINKDYEPPFGHAELLGLDAFCRKLNIPVEKARSELEANRIKLTDNSESLARIAENNGITPMKLYSLIEHLEPAISPPADATSLTPEAIEERFAGSGIGRKTVREIAGLMHMDAAEIKARLAVSNIEVKEGEALRKAAKRNNLSPMELLKAILIEDYRPKR